ncbi:hypothetical protein E2986_13434 [Frieseomelitta varia]|uniref:Uncharacterized protein n=1 Tax=Frieseomelitta varia TaxID=561572 RepID=A0A833RQ88_9HYME|nr:hypothetical protein E2986_13434 [Frieseomelitta varia]
MSKSEIIYKTLQNETNNSLEFEAMIPWIKELTEENLPDHIIFPKELNLFLRNRIQDLIAENGCLHRTLDEMEDKIKKKKGITETAQILGKPNEIAAAKIIELSKRCREQIAEIEVLKSKCKNLEVHITNKETELENERHESRRLKTDASSHESELY